MTSSLENLAEKIGNALKKHGLTLATAESCTGGGLSYWITSTSGSSAWFDRGFVTYSDAAKVDILDVNPATIQSFGAVSEATAREMAEGALKMSTADISIAITGIAGPTGGSPQKPVGTVWIAYAKQHELTQTHVEVFPGNRQEIRDGVIQHIFERLLKIL
jgi:nicotinamide-nucleotide amidase